MEESLSELALDINAEPTKQHNTGNDESIDDNLKTAKESTADGLSLNTSSLLSPASLANKTQVKGLFDPIEQMMESDSDSDPEDGTNAVDNDPIPVQTVHAETPSEFDIPINSSILKRSIPPAIDQPPNEDISPHLSEMSHQMQPSNNTAGDSRSETNVQPSRLNDHSPANTSIVSRLWNGRRNRTINEEEEEEDNDEGAYAEANLTSDDANTNNGSTSIPKHTTKNDIGKSRGETSTKKTMRKYKTKAKKSRTYIEDADPQLDADNISGPKPRSPRAASKAAILKMQQETERLVRETAVKIDPLEFTRRLTLDDFYDRYDMRTSNSNKQPVVLEKVKPHKHHKVEPVVQETFSYYASDGDDYDVDIVESPPTQSQTATDNPEPSVLSGHIAQSQTLKSPKPNKNNLEGILRYGSQPIHASGECARSAEQLKADGPLALGYLNRALLDAVNRQSAEQKLKSKKKRAPTAADKESANIDHEHTSHTEENQNNDDNENQDASQSDYQMSADESDIDVLQHTVRAGGKVIISDDDDDDDEDNEDDGANNNNRSCIAEISGAQSEDTNGPNTTKPKQTTKASFMGLFKIPLKRPAINNFARSSPDIHSGTGYSRTDTEQTQLENAIPASQDLSYILPTQHTDIGTQDSLLSSPSDSNAQYCLGQQAELANNSTEAFNMPDYSIQRAHSTQQTQLKRSTQPTQQTQQTQPTQQTQQTQPTQQTQMADGTVDNNFDFPSLPSLVRKELEEISNGSNPSDSNITTDDVSGHINAVDELAEDIHSDMLLSDSITNDDPKRNHRRTLVRRSTTISSVAKKRQSHRMRLKSEFIEAEAEEGESSDSDGDENMYGSRKFNWGESSAKDKKPLSDDEDDLDIDSDEEAAALMADPMINHDDIDDAEGEAAVRELYHQRDLEQDEQDVKNLIKDITTGSLMGRYGRSKSKFELADEEDYNDRQARAERMEDRLRLQRKLLAKDMHDASLVKIAKNPDTAAFAHAVLMRLPKAPKADFEDESYDGNASEPDEELYAEAVSKLDEDSLKGRTAVSVQSSLSVSRMRVENDSESELGDPLGSLISDGDASNEKAILVDEGSSVQSAIGKSKSSNSLFTNSDVFDQDPSFSVEKLIVRRRTLLTSAAATRGTGSSSFSYSGTRNDLNAQPPLLLKRPGSHLFALQQPSKRPNTKGK